MNMEPAAFFTLAYFVFHLLIMNRLYNYLSGDGVLGDTLDVTDWIMVTLWPITGLVCTYLWLKGAWEKYHAQG